MSNPEKYQKDWLSTHWIWKTLRIFLKGKKQTSCSEMQRRVLPGLKHSGEGFEWVSY